MHHDLRGEGTVGVLVLDFDETLFQVTLSWVEVFCDLMGRLAGTPGASAVQELRTWLEGSKGLPLTAMVDAARTRVPELDRLPADDVRRHFDEEWRRVSDPLHTMATVTPGMAELVEGAAGAGIPVYVLTGGDVDHKRGIIAALPLGRSIPSRRVVGDGDPRLGRARTKVDGLRAILAEVGVRPGEPGGGWAAFLADGLRDFEAAAACRVLSLGLGPSAAAADVDVGAYGVDARWVLADVLGAVDTKGES